MAIQKPFVVRNGIEVNSNLIFGDILNDRVGIGTTQPIDTLTVVGGIAGTTINLTGIGTIPTIIGNSLNYSTGNIVTGVITSLSGSTLNYSGIATAGSYQVGATEVISSARELKNIVSLDSVTTATIESAIANAPNTFTDLSVTGISTLGTVKIASGIVTATSGIVTYYGDGKFLQNILSGVGVATAGGTVGTGATIIDFRGPGISTVTVSSGIATVNIVGGGGAVSIGITAPPDPANGDLWYSPDYGRTFVWYDEVALGIGSTAVWVDAAPFNVNLSELDSLELNNLSVLYHTSLNTLNVSGISTLGNVVVGSGLTDLIVNGDARVTGILTVGTSSLTLNGNTNQINGVTISAGIITATSFVGDGANLTNVSTVIQDSGIEVSNSITTLNFTGNVGIVTSGNTATISIGSPAVLGWDAEADTFAYYIYGTDTKVRDLGDTTRDYKNLDVQSRVRRCVISTGGTVQYYLDADDSTYQSGNWLRIVERQGLDNVGTSTHYTGIHTEAAHPGLREGVPDWSAGTYTQGSRVIYSGSLWECVTLSTTATPAAGITTSNLSGTNGQVMVEIPAFSVRHTKYNNVHTFQVALGVDLSGQGFEVHPAFVRADGTYRSHIYLGAYQGTGATSSGGLTSVSGVNNVTNATRGTFRTAASGIGTGWHQLGYYEMAAVQFLMVTEFDAVNIQKVLGNGAMNGNVYVVNTGLSNSSGNKSQNANTPSTGSTSDYISYRGLENIYGRAWQWADGFNAFATSVYLNKNWTTWADDTATNYNLIGSVPTGSASYQRDFRSDNNLLLPSSASGGSAATYIADGLWTSTGWRVALVGGNAVNGSLVGPFCLLLNDASSAAFSSIGGRLSWAPV